MTAPGPANDEFLILLGSLAEEQLSPEQADRLDELLAADPAKCRQYAEFMLMVSGLRWTWSERDDSTSNRIDEQSAHETSAVGPPPLHDSPFIVFDSEYPASTCHSRAFGFHGLVGGTLFSYAIIAMILSAGLLAAWAWKMPSRSLELAKVESTVKSKSAPVSGKTASVSGFRPAESAIRVFDAADMIGNGSISESGAQQFAYGTGTKVSLRAPFKFGVPSANSGALFYGKSTVYVTTGSPFSLTMPNTMLTCSGGEFGVDIDRSGEGWIQVFRGGATLWVPNSDVEARQKIVLGENESVRIRQGDGRCMATVIHDADLAASLAARMPPRLPPQDGGKEPSPAALAWKPNATALKGSAAALPVAAETGTFLLCARASTGKSPPDAPGSTNHTRGVRFSLSELLPHVNRADLVPGKCLLEVRFVARRFVVYAIRLNGKEIRLPEERFDGAVEQMGAVRIHDGFVGGDGTDVLEFDVRNTEPGQVLPEVLDSDDGPVAARLRVFVSKAAPPKAPSANNNAAEKK